MSSLSLSLVPARVRRSGEHVAVDDTHCRLGLLVTYNPWHLDPVSGISYHDDELEFLGPRNQ